MKLKRTAAKTTFVGAMSITAAGFDAGMAQAESATVADSGT